jgi:hypothetical protein
MRARLMSDTTADTSRSRFDRLPAWLRPYDSERPGRGDLRRVETTVLALVGVLLAVATVNDVVRQTHVNQRLTADLYTWRSYTHHDYRLLSLEQDFTGHTTRDVVCGNTSPGQAGIRTQVCLVLTGPVIKDRSGPGRREARGGYYLPPHRSDVRRYRYACFGTAVERELCLH